MKMKEYDKKTRIYMAVTVIFIAVCLFLIFEMTLGNGGIRQHDPYLFGSRQISFKPDITGSQEDEVTEIKVTDSDGARAIEDGLHNILPLKGVSLHFNENYTAVLSGVMTKSDLSRLIDDGEISLPPLVKMAVEFLSEEVTISAVISIELDSETGRLNAPLQSLTISGIDIDPGFLPENSQQAINDAVNGFVGEGGTIQSLDIGNGVMSVQVV